LLHALIGILLDFAACAPAQTNWKRKLQFAAPRLLLPGFE